MSKSKFALSNEQINHKILHTLIVDVGTPIMKEKVTLEALKISKSINNFINQKCQKNLDNNDKRTLMPDGCPVSNLDNADITLLVKIADKCKLFPETELKTMRELRDLKNKHISHITKTSIDLHEFEIVALDVVQKLAEIGGTYCVINLVKRELINTGNSQYVLIYEQLINAIKKILNTVALSEISAEYEIKEAEYWASIDTRTKQALEIAYEIISSATSYFVPGMDLVSTNVFCKILKEMDVYDEEQKKCMDVYYEELKKCTDVYYEKLYKCMDVQVYDEAQKEAMKLMNLIWHTTTSV